MFVFKKIEKVDNIIDEMNTYFSETSPEKILTDWEKSSKYDCIGIKAKDFLIETKKYFKFDKKEVDYSELTIKTQNPKYPSGFSLI